MAIENTFEFLVPMQEISNNTVTKLGILVDGKYLGPCIEDFTSEYDTPLDLVAYSWSKADWYLVHRLLRRYFKSIKASDPEEFRKLQERVQEFQRADDGDNIEIIA